MRKTCWKRRATADSLVELCPQHVMGNCKGLKSCVTRGIERKGFTRLHRFRLQSDSAATAAENRIISPKEATNSHVDMRWFAKFRISRYHNFSDTSQLLLDLTSKWEMGFVISAQQDYFVLWYKQGTTPLVYGWRSLRHAEGEGTFWKKVMDSS